MDSTPDARFQRALDSLEGLSVGDAFGEGFFLNAAMAARLMATDEFDLLPGLSEDAFLLSELIDRRRTDFHASPWGWTDDTAMALEIVAELRERGAIDADSLGARFSKRYLADPMRGYGGAMFELLPQLGAGDALNRAAALFEGTGSYGNGAAMRVAPLGAYYADDLEACIAQAEVSARVTHAHPEGVAGAIAVAVATLLAARARADGSEIEPKVFIDEVRKLTPEGEVHTRLREARDFPEDFTSEQAAEIAGAGYAVAAQDTVAFCVWCAAHFLPHFEEAMWNTVAGLGDRDTTCAIVGGIVGAYVGTDGIPASWRAAREPLPGF